MTNNLFIKQFNQFVEEHKLFSTNDLLIVACSGGVDSVVLSHILFTLQYRFILAHCNFKLRGEESDMDEYFVKDLAKKYKVPFYSISFNTQQKAEQLKRSIQETARILRYDWFYQLAEQTQANAVLTAHHFNDSVETFFINLLRGSGINGLAGISHQYRIFKRPLTPFKKEEILLYAQQNNLRYRTDSSNHEDYYLRNRLRNHLIPLLEEVSDKGLAGVLKSIQLLSNERKLVHYAVNILSENARLKTDKEKILFDLHYLHQLDLLDAALYHLLSPFGFSGVQCQQIIQSYRLKRSGKYFYAPHKTAILNRNIVEIINLEPAQEKFTEYFIYKENSMEYPVRIEIEERGVNEQYKTNNNQYIAYFDADKLQWPLKLRYWQEGDAFVPLGMKQLKKLSDFFIDQKISVSDKKNSWIIKNGNGDIIWLPGYRISELAKITDNSKRMCVLKFYTEF